MVPNQEPVNWNSFGKVMIVDDEPMMVEFTREFIEKQSLDCEIYENGQDAIDGFLRNRGQVGLVILDIVMPKADGFEAYSAIRAMDPNVKILFYSGYMKDNEQIKNLLDQPNVGFIKKPFTVEALTSALSDL